MRLFLAIDLPTKTKQQIFAQLAELRDDYPDCTWVDAANYHITVHFFGEVTEVAKVKGQLERLLYDRNPFHLYLRGIDLFIKNKITLHITFLRQKELEETARRVSEFYGQANGQRVFVPHLTIGRCRIPSKQQYFAFKKRILKITVDGDFPVKRLVLFESDLRGKKPVYRPIHVFPLAEKLE